MIPGMIGKNIGIWPEGGGMNVPATVSHYGTSPEEIFVTYETLHDRYGEAVEELPLGAIGLYTFSDKLKVGLQQLMAGTRCFQVSAISLCEVMSLTAEAAKVSGIPYVMDAYREQAERIING